MSGGRNDPLLLRLPLGSDTRPFEESTLHAIALTAVERLSAPFDIELIAVSTERAIDPDELPGQQASVTVRRREGLQRHRPPGGRRRLCPAWPLAVAARSGTPALVPRPVNQLQHLPAENGGRDPADHPRRAWVEPVEFRIFGDQRRRKYTTESKETNLVFVQRMLQEPGYFYFFEHTASQHTLVFADSNEAFRMMEWPSYRMIQNGENVDIFDTWSESLRRPVSR